MASMILILLSQTGLVSSLFYELGFIENWYEFPKIVGGMTPYGTIISFCIKFIPFIGISVLSVLQTFPREYEYQSYTLGVSKIKTLFFVTFPALKSSIISTSMIVFCYTFGCYEVPQLLGNKETLSMIVYNYYNNPALGLEGYYQAYAISLIIALITLTISAIYLYTMFSKEDKQ